MSKLNVTPGTVTDNFDMDDVRSSMKDYASINQPGFDKVDEVMELRKASVPERGGITYPTEIKE